MFTGVKGWWARPQSVPGHNLVQNLKAFTSDCFEFYCVIDVSNSICITLI